MAIFKFPITMAEEGTTSIFGSWVCVADAPGGFSSHLDAQRLINPALLIALPESPIRYGSYPLIKRSNLRVFSILKKTKKFIIIRLPPKKGRHRCSMRP
jgi:hypothetical protein